MGVIGPTYAGAPETLIAHWQKRRAPMDCVGAEGLPPLDTDLCALRAARLPVPALPLDDTPSRHAAKEYELRVEFAGRPPLLMLHGLLVAHLRKREFPSHAPALFHRLWQEQSEFLIDALPTRWLISAVITFGDHGATTTEQLLGREMGMLFSLMKLYEFERLHSGKAPDQAYGLRRVNAELPFGMTSFSLVSGGLDVNLLAPLWQRAQAEPTLGPLACALLTRLNEDPGGLFRRIGEMRAKKRARIAARKGATE